MVTSSAQGGPCSRALSELGRIGLDGAVEVSKALFYPVWVPFHLGVRARQGYRSKGAAEAQRESWQALRGTRWSAAGWGASLLLAHVFRTTLDELDEATPEFDAVGEEGQVVVANLIPPTDGLHSLATVEAQARHKGVDPSRVHVLVARDYDDLLAKLQAIAREHGPISRIDTFGHGSKGVLQVGGSVVPGPSAVEGLPVGVTLPGAMVRVHACGAGNGEEGTRLLEIFGGALLPEGGQVFGCQTLMYSNPADALSHWGGGKRPPEWVRKGSQTLLDPVLGIAGAGHLFKVDYSNKFPLRARIKKVEILPLK